MDRLPRLQPHKEIIIASNKLRAIVLFIFIKTLPFQLLLDAFILRPGNFSVKNPANIRFANRKNCDMMKKTKKDVFA